MFSKIKMMLMTGMTVMMITQVEASTLVFLKENWKVQQVESLQAGSQLHIVYDNDRLPQCRSTYNGFPSWDILVHVVFHLTNSTEERKKLVQSVARGQIAQFDIPVNAEQVELWFVSGGVRCSGVYYDSNFGKNYWFDIQP